MPRNVKRTQDAPHERLGEIADDMLQMLEHSPKDPQRRVKAIILLDDMVEGRGTAALSGYEPDEKEQAVRRMLEHVSAIVKAEGIDLARVLASSNWTGGQ